MAQINPYIHFNGNAEEAFIFYKSVFGGAFAMIIRFKDMLVPEHPVAENEADKIMHIALPVHPLNDGNGKCGRHLEKWFLDKS